MKPREFDYGNTIRGLMGPILIGLITSGFKHRVSKQVDHEKYFYSFDRIGAGRLCR